MDVSDGDSGRVDRWAGVLVHGLRVICCTVVWGFGLGICCWMCIVCAMGGKIRCPRAYK